MKIIGFIKPEINESGELTNSDYANGSIVMLTEAEISIIASLQKAWDKASFIFSTGRNFELDDRKMDDAFLAVKIFTETKFAINEFEEMVKSLNSILIKDKINEL